MKNLKRFISHGRNWLAAILVIFFVFVAVAAPLLSPDDPKRPGPYKYVGKISETEPKPPSENAPLGTLPRQISVYHLLVWGTRDAMRFGLLVALSTACVGIVFGAVAGYAGGAVNRILMRVADAFLTFPIIAAVVLLRQLWENTINTIGGSFLVSMVQRDPGYQIPSQSPIQVLLQHVNPLTLSLILFSWMPYARLVNTLVIELKKTEFILAARAVGVRPARILFRHLLPNAITPAVVLAARDVGSFVVFQATLTFIGIGGNSLWGAMLATGRNWIIGPGGNVLAYWWVFIPATLAVILFGIAWNLFGDGLGELLDPYTRSF
jgi:peptide/nickel transport system permease protein